ncbi:diguanylate cyclase/phosphodiesterase [Campylobacter sputorum subsp. bubulus]|uniref:Molybdopterin molybdenumtransferase n=1 Tax=Campylobacter sputorum subsp. sputorum TaxID=32024 RepID=A0A381DI07_9BACT|nr:molybdopterin molybdotransferase MoeA [Campylobacter sputorum]ASM35376.1 molybdopterin molybdenumtransferase [Campylobacter sputorum aubsp. sputorum RM3237]KAB0582880.1 molybdopterin molybdotransferase MoeA [Campylobacter sputorum subsp. sputorum]QEL05568.1 molybdopterin molybdenumtransferase [Campylobacter sputorum subsp. sputorum]SUX08611.1 diguanylate cyclase/phosphodiesterase [Campylobacter sputorum subsp. bubulus]SUX10333.1 diguanylate cyclase/phosphodiesterase [Campylobacter sputorum 
MKFKSYEETLKTLKNSIKPCEKIQKVAITSALNRILAVDIIAKENYPQYETSAMDGYACKFSDLSDGKLKILGDIPAGTNPMNIGLKDGECIKTFTGSLMCKNSDTLIPIENVDVKDGYIFINQGVKKGFAVRKIGESYKKDDILIRKGTKLSYSEIALLAELGEFHISVFMKPKVGVLATGSEIRDLGEALQTPAQIHSSNHIAIASMLELMGCEAVILPIIKDEKNLVKEAIINGIKSCDMLITTGGVSVGDYDFVKSSLKENCEILVDGAAIKPGRHIKIAKFNDKYIFALPGFPYSAMVMCVLYVRVLINELFCIKEENEIEAILSQDYVKKTEFLEFTACNITFKDGKVFANLEGKKSGSSAIINNLNNNAALLICPLEKKDGLKKGEVVKVLKML